MKQKSIKDRKDIVVYALVIVALTILIIIIVCNRCNFIDMTNTIVTLVGIVMAFISILLSYKGLRVTNEVKKEVGLQQFRIKRHEEVAIIVHTLNSKSYNIMFYTNGRKSQANITANLFGLVELSKNKEHDFSNYKHCPVFCEDNNAIGFLYDHAGNPYLPKSIAVAIISLVQDNQDKEGQDSNGRVKFCEIYDREIYTCQNPNSSIKICRDWETFVGYLDALIQSIQKWYREENYNTEINLCRLYRINNTYPAKQ